MDLVSPPLPISTLNPWRRLLQADWRPESYRKTVLSTEQLLDPNNNKVLTTCFKSFNISSQNVQLNYFPCIILYESSSGVVSWQNWTLCATLAVCFSRGTMPLSVRVKHRCKESITEMDLYLTYYNIYPYSNCLFWYKKIN